MRSWTENEVLMRWGYPVRVDRADALRKLGRRAEVHPRDVYAYRMPNRLAALAAQAINLHVYELPTLGKYADSGGVVTVLDLRPKLRKNDVKITDPSLPDE